MGTRDGGRWANGRAGGARGGARGTARPGHVRAEAPPRGPGTARGPGGPRHGRAGPRATALSPQQCQGHGPVHSLSVLDPGVTNASAPSCSGRPWGTTVERPQSRLQTPVRGML